MVAGAAARAARRARLPVQRRLGVRRSAGAARRAGGARVARARSRRSAHAKRTGSTTGRASPARARSPTRCASNASGARCAPTRGPRRAADRRRADLRRARAASTRRRGPELFLPRGRRRGAAGSLHRARPALGEPALRLARAAPDGYRWWIERFRRTFELVDVARIDHFRGFVSYWAVPSHTERRGTAGGGAARAPRVFRAAEAELGGAAGDRRGPRRDHARRRAAARRARPAGNARAPVRPDGGAPEPAPAREPREDCVVYTGTHDNDTAAGWWASLSKRQRAATTGSIRRSRTGA